MTAYYNKNYKARKNIGARYVVFLNIYGYLPKLCQFSLLDDY